jgi:hypothetical protein
MLMVYSASRRKNPPRIHPLKALILEKCHPLLLRVHPPPTAFPVMDSRVMPKQMDISSQFLLSRIPSDRDDYKKPAHFDGHIPATQSKSGM